MQVLIVDDNPDDIAIARQRLKGEDLEIISAEDGRSGLDAAKRHKPDLILLDLELPDLDGFEVCRVLKGDPDLCLVPVVFLTASCNPDDVARGLDVGAVDYVTKPFNVYELRARVRAALRTKHLQDLLIQHSHLDPLTGLSNRRMLMERLQQEWARIERHGGNLSFIMADVDYFKHINDRFGHGIGDRLLQEVAKVIANQCRQYDLPARYGGDEFAIIVPDELAVDAANLAERCRQYIEKIRIKVNGQEVNATVSFGVAEADGLDSAEDLAKMADKALYDAKRAGRNGVKYNELVSKQHAGNRSGLRAPA